MKKNEFNLDDMVKLTWANMERVGKIISKAVVSNTYLVSFEYIKGRYIKKWLNGEVLELYINGEIS